jgi:hypothetical protein
MTRFSVKMTAECQTGRGGDFPAPKNCARKLNAATSFELSGEGVSRGRRSRQDRRPYDRFLRVQFLGFREIGRVHTKAANTLLPAFCERHQTQGGAR